MKEDLYNGLLTLKYRKLQSWSCNTKYNRFGLAWKTNKYYVSWRNVNFYWWKYLNAAIVFWKQISIIYREEILIFIDENI